jgi:hypothetical protein
MTTRPLRHLMLGAVVLGLAASPALAQQSGTGDSTGGDSGDQGGLTGQMTTTPQAKSDDAAGSRGNTAAPGDVSVTPGTAPTGEQDCTATQRWDEQAMACVEQ